MPRRTPRRTASSEDIAALRIRYERARRDWSTEELARRVANTGTPINQSAVWRIENGSPRRKISLDEAVSFADVFGLTLGELMALPDELVTAEASQLITELMFYAAQFAEYQEEIERVLPEVRKIGNDLRLAELRGVRRPPDLPTIADLRKDLARRFPWMDHD